MTTPSLPPLDTPEALWAYLLTLWHSESLPTPQLITVDGAAVWLPRNERGQVEAWAQALGIGGTGHLSDLVNRDGSPKKETFYSCSAWERLRIGVFCHIDLTADADAHGGPVVRTELATAAEDVASMLGGGRDE